MALLTWRRERLFDGSAHNLALLLRRGLLFLQKIPSPSSATSLSNAVRVTLPDFISGTLPLPLTAMAVESSISPYKHHPPASIIAALVTIVEMSLQLVPAPLQSLMQSTVLTVESYPELVTAGISRWIQFPRGPLTSISASPPEKPEISDSHSNHRPSFNTILDDEQRPSIEDSLFEKTVTASLILSFLAVRTYEMRAVQLLLP